MSLLSANNHKLERALWVERVQQLVHAQQVGLRDGLLLIFQLPRWNLMKEKINDHDDEKILIFKKSVFNSNFLFWDVNLFWEFYKLREWLTIDFVGSIGNFTWWKRK